MKLTSPQKLPDLNLWLTKQNLPKSNLKNYSLLLLKEDQAQREKLIQQLKEVAEDSVCDLKNLIIEVKGANLDPLDTPDVKEKKDKFIEKLKEFLTVFDERTLQGYFGETLTGLIVLGFSPFEISEWKIPVFLYRHHIHSYDAFEKWQQSGKLPRAMVGRAGEDNIAFFKDVNDIITAELRCEAKCTTSHNSNLINEAHNKFDDSTSESTEIQRIIMILRDYRSDQTAEKWIKALQTYIWQQNHKSHHLICYVCQDMPKTPKDRLSWIHPDKLNENYKSLRPLQAVEIHLNDIAKLIRAIYNPKERPHG